MVIQTLNEYTFLAAAHRTFSKNGQNFGVEGKRLKKTPAEMCDIAARSVLGNIMPFSDRLSHETYNNNGFGFACMRECVCVFVFGT